MTNLDPLREVAPLFVANAVATALSFQRGASFEDALHDLTENELPTNKNERYVLGLMFMAAQQSTPADLPVINDVEPPSRKSVSEMPDNDWCDAALTYVVVAAQLLAAELEKM